MQRVFKSTRLITKFPNVLQWFKLISVTGGAQAVIQAITLISGIYIIRFLPTREYAFYTLANTMFGSLTLLADGGIANGVMAQGGKVWQDKDKLGSVIVTGLDLRKKFAIGSLLVVFPVLTYLLHFHGASWLTCVLICGALIPAFLGALSDTLLEIPAKLHQDIVPLQKNQLIVGVGRLILITVSIFLFPFTYVALLGNGIPRLLGNIGLKKLTTPYVNYAQPSNKDIKKELLSVVKRFMPGVIYFCLSGQITIWLLSIFGTTNSLAQIGALSRITAILVLYSVTFATLIQPRFARLPEVKSVIFKTYIKIFAGTVILSVLIVLVIFLFSSQVLWVLGNQYRNLNKELVLCVIGGCLGTIVSGSTFSLLLSRGWIINPVLSIIINIAAVVAAALLINVTSLRGVLLFNIFVAIIQFILNFSYIVFNILKIKSV